MDSLTLEDITTSNGLIISEVEKNAYGAGAALKIFDQVKGKATFSVDYFIHLKVDVQKSRSMADSNWIRNVLRHGMSSNTSNG